VLCGLPGRGNAAPLFFGERKIAAVEILDRWLAPGHRYFKVRGDDGGRYILRHDTATDAWELTWFACGQES
jgi:hypothetical protein